jgi:hypothetical protein
MPIARTEADDADRLIPIAGSGLDDPHRGIMIARAVAA